MGKTKVMISGPNLHSLIDSGKYPCGVCRSGIGVNSIFCSGCSHWVHAKCSGLGSIKPDPNFQCSRCLGRAHPMDGRPTTDFIIEDQTLDVVDYFCYLGDMTSAGGGCELSTITCVRTAWSKFRELVPMLTSRSLSPHTRGQINNTYVRSAMLHASECSAPTKQVFLRMQRNDRAMIRWICNVSSDSLLQKLNIHSLESTLRYNRLHWHGHVERSDAWINRVMHHEVEGNRSRGRPKKSWIDAIKEDHKSWKMTRTDATDRTTWRSALRTAMSKRASRV